MKKIVLTGGGTAGHVTPNLALIDELKSSDYDISYIGRKEKDKTIIEKELCENLNIPYYGISSGKLRRYLSIENLKDSLRVLKGVTDARTTLKKLKPDIVFSKGGFVTAPVIFAAKTLKIPVVIHESDLTPGLANKLSMNNAEVILTSFEETLNYLPKDKGIVTGPPIRRELLNGDISIAKSLCNFKEEKPVLLIIGGSTGAKKINEAILGSVNELTKKFNIIHIVGNGNLTETKLSGYYQVEYLKSQLKDCLKYADIVISRAGSNSIFELLSLNKPHILIPLPKSVSRGDQIDNAKSFEQKGYSVVVDEETLTADILLSSVDNLYKNKEKYIDTMKKSNFTNGIDKVIEQIVKYTK